ncbi:MAG: hypothetical protein ACLPX5_07950 [Dissulfurispiraceae bacterium]
MSIYRIPEQNTPLSQGDIFVNIPYWRPHRKTKESPWPNIDQRGNVVLDLQSNPYAVLATQTCDVAHAKELLFVVATTADVVVATLIANPGRPISEGEFRTWIVTNLHPRYHFFEQYRHDDHVIIPELVANFRRPFTLRSEYVVEKLIPDGHRVLSLEGIYSAEFGNRFGQYYSRVATERNMESS